MTRNDFIIKIDELIGLAMEAKLDGLVGCLSTLNASVITETEVTLLNSLQAYNLSMIATLTGKKDSIIWFKDMELKQSFVEDGYTDLIKNYFKN